MMPYADMDLDRQIQVGLSARWHQIITWNLSSTLRQFHRKIIICKKLLFENESPWDILTSARDKWGNVENRWAVLEFIYIICFSLIPYRLCRHGTKEKKTPQEQSSWRLRNGKKGQAKMLLQEEGHAPEQRKS